MYKMTIAVGLALATVSAPVASQAQSTCAEVDQAKKALSVKLSPPEPRAGAAGAMAGARGAQQDMQASRHQQDVQAPRQQQEVQAPRQGQQDVQAPRAGQQDTQSPRMSQGAGSGPDLARAQGLITEAEKACTAGKKTEAASKAREALTLLK